MSISESMKRRIVMVIPSLNIGLSPLSLDRRIRFVDSGWSNIHVMLFDNENSARSYIDMRVVSIVGNL
jgi:hypothetical protein